jgi:PPOX class probable F420-dependent enzyme
VPVATSNVAELPDACGAILAKTGLAQAATLGADGAPHCTPVWYEWDGLALRFSTTTNRQKYRNLTRDPRLAANVLDVDNPMSYVELRGRAEFDFESGLAFIDHLARRYLGQDSYPWHEPGDVRVTVALRPTRFTWLVT